MPNINELINNVALQLSESTDGQVWYSNLDLKNAYSQHKLCESTSKQRNLSLLRGEAVGTYRFLTRVYGFGNMSNEFQRVMVSLLKGIPFTNCLTDDILVASEGT